MAPEQATNLDALIDAYLADHEADHRPLAARLAADPMARRRLVERSVAEAQLRRACRSAAGHVQRQQASVIVWCFRGLAAAALLLLGIFAGQRLTHDPQREHAIPPLETYTVLAGQALVNGQPGQPLRDGATVTVAGTETLKLLLPDGSRADFQPGCELKLRHLDRDDVRQWIELDRGQAEFRVAKDADNRRFEIETKAGVVTVLGTVFSMAYQPGEQGHLDVMVQEGKVRVDHLGGSNLVEPGEREAFTRKGPTRRSLRGRLLEYNEALGTVWVKTDQDRLYPLRTDVRMSSEDLQDPLRVLTPGAMVELQIDAGRRVSVVQVLCPRLEGTLLSIDAGRGLITLAEDRVQSEPRILHLSPTVTLGSGQRLIGIEEFEAHDEVLVVLGSDRDMVTEMRKR